MEICANSSLCDGTPASSPAFHKFPHSRSLLFFAEPLTHTGIRATYAASDTLSLVAGVNNGWNYSSLTTSGSLNDRAVKTA